MCSTVCSASSTRTSTHASEVIHAIQAGVNPPVNQMSQLMAFVSNLSVTRWAVEPLGKAEGKCIDVYGADNVYWWQQHFGFQDRYWMDIGALVAMGLGFRVMTALAPRQYSRKLRC